MVSPRERVLMSLAHEEPDRTPCDFWAEPPTMRRLFAHLGHSDEERLLRNLGVDVRHVSATMPPEREIGGGIRQNMWG